MGTLIDVILPVFLVIGFGYVAAWRNFFPDEAVGGLMKFAQNFGVPVLLFRGISTLDLGANFDISLLGAFYTGAVSGFIVGLLGARFLFKRDWPDAVAIGFTTLFSNGVLLGLPIMERAYGPDSLGPNFAIIAFHAPFCYTLGVTAMEIALSGGKGVVSTFLSVLKNMVRNPLVIAISLGAVVNVTGTSLPGPVSDAVDLIARAALPAALFGLGGVLVQYKPEGDLRIVAMIAMTSLMLHPAVTYLMGMLLKLEPHQMRSAVIFAAMAPGVNAFLFANMYGVAKRTAATGVLVATGLAIITVWFWLHVLGPMPAG